MDDRTISQIPNPSLALQVPPAFFNVDGSTTSDWVYDRKVTTLV